MRRMLLLCCAARNATGRRSSRPPVSGSRIASGCAEVEGVLRRSCFTAIAIRRRWEWPPSAMGLCAKFPTRRLSISMPGAAAWQARSGTRKPLRCNRALSVSGAFPANTRCAAPAVIVAAGTSCRHQIHDFTGVSAVIRRYCCVRFCSWSGWLEGTGFAPGFGVISGFEARTGAAAPLRRGPVYAGLPVASARAAALILCQQTLFESE